jgi:hypothetical protein
MPNFILHIGPHKTGSTYIQKYLYVNRERFLKLGFNYPSVAIGPQYGHHQVFDKIKSLPQGDLSEYMRQFLGGAVNFVSSEKFDRLRPDDIKRLGASLADLDVKIVYYRRNYVDLLPSWWQERVKHGSRLSFYEFVLPHILRPFTSNIINPCKVLDPYAEVFGRENIAVVDYDAARKGGGILPPLFDMLGIEPGPIKDEVINRSVNLELVEIIRALNMLAEFDGERRSHDVRAIFLRKRRSATIRHDVESLSGVIHEHMKPLKPLKLSGAFFANAVKAAFRRKYEACFVNDFVDELPDREIVVPSDNWMLQKDAVRRCENIYRHIMADDILESERRVLAPA